MRKTSLWPVLVGLLLMLSVGAAACGPAPTETVSPLSPLPTTQPQASATPAKSAQVEETAQQDLAERLGISKDEIELASVEAVDWPDASLGCPQPDMVYAQVITPGYRIVLQANGQRFEYHTGGDSLVLCGKTEKSEEPVSEKKPIGRELDPQVAPLVEEARKDLVERFNLATEQIMLQSVETVQWRNSSLGCPKPGMNYLMVITPGYLLQFEVGGKTYEYHTSDRHVVYCDDPQPPLDSGSGSD